MNKYYDIRSPVKIFFCFFLPALVLLTYFGTFNGEFLFDDFPRILGNPGLEDPQDIEKVLTVGMPSRPFLMLTLAMNKYLGGNQSFGYHLFNTVLHALNAILLFILLRFLLSASKSEVLAESKNVNILPLTASSIFAIHPLQTESVSYVICRSGELATLYYLFAVLCYLKAAKGEKSVFYYCATFVFALAGVMSKEMAVSIPAVIFFADYLFVSGCDLKRCLKRYIKAIPFCLIVFYVAVVLVRMDAGVGIYERGVYTTMLTQINVVLFYIKLLIFPVNQAFDYDFPVFRSFTDFPTPISFSVIFCMIAGAFWVHKQHKLFAFSILWLFITLSPTSSVVPIDDIIFEHRLYLPSIGFSVFLALIILSVFFRSSTGERSKTHAAVLIITLISLLSINALHRNNIYTSSLAFWEDAAIKAPWKDRPHNNLATVYGHRKEYNKAVKALKRALLITPEHSEARANLGEIYYHLGRLKESEVELQKVIENDSEMAQANYFLGRIAERQGSLKIAGERYEKAVKRDPKLLPARNKLGGVFLKKGELTDALFHFKEVLKKAPEDTEANTNIGIVYGSMGFFDLAVKYLNIALKTDPENSQILQNLSYATQRINRKKKGTN